MSRARSVLLFAFLLALAIGNVVTQATYRLPADGGNFRLLHGQVVLERGTGDLAVVPPRARLLRIDEQEVESPGRIARVLETHRIGDVCRYHFVIDGSPRDVAVHVHAAPTELARYVPLFALSLLFWVVTMQAILSLPVPPGVVPLLAAAFAILGFSYTGRLDVLDAAFYALDSLGRIFLGPAALLLALSAGRERRISRLAVAALFGAPPLLVVAGFLALFYAGAPVSPLVELTDRLLLAFAAVGILAALAALLLRGRHARGVSRDRMRWAGVALGFGALPFALSTLLPLAFAPQPETVSVAGALFLVVVPLALSRSLDPFRVSLARRTEERCLSVTVIAFALGSAACVALVLVAPFISKATPAVLVAFGGAAVATVRLVSAGERLARRMRLGPRESLQASLASFGEELLPLREPEPIARRAAERLCESFGLDGVVISASGALLGEAGRGAVSAATTVTGRRTIGGLDVEILLGSPAPVRVSIPGGASHVGRLSLLCVPSGDDLDGKDLDLIATFALLCFRAVENALLFDALQGRMNETERLSRENAQVIEASAAAMVLCLPDGRVKTANRNFLQLLSLEGEAVQGVPCEEVLPRDLLQELSDNGLPARHKVELGGKTRVVEARRTRLSDGGFLITLLDVTLEAMLEVTMRERERLGDMGVLTAQVVHEVATPLTGVSSYAQLLGQKVKDDPALLEMVKKIQAQAERASEIARSVLGKVKAGAGASQDVARPLDVDLFCHEIADVLGPLYVEKKVTLHCEIEGPVKLRSARRGKLEQVLVNLLLNARDASPAGGEVRLSAERGAGGVVISVSDLGPGIDPKLLDHIFDPYFTTKESGTGLGLFVARRLVAELSGTLEVRSVQGQGTTMRVTLPDAG